MRGRVNWVAGVGLLCLLGSVFAPPALAQKGGSSGGGGAGGSGGGNSGGGGGGGQRNGIFTSTQTFDDWNIPYNGLYPQGQAVFSYSADGATKSLNIQVSNINVPDGTVMTIETEEIWTTPTGSAFTISTYPITIRQQKGTLSLSTTNGDSVMFLPPSMGQNYVYLFDPANRALMGLHLGG